MADLVLEFPQMYPIRKYKNWHYNLNDIVSNYNTLKIKLKHKTDLTTLSTDMYSNVRKVDKLRIFEPITDVKKNRSQ
jgi:hypothetical protein